MADPKAILAIGMPKGEPVAEEEEEDMPESQPAKGMGQMKLSAARRALAAFESGDAAALDQALTDHYKACSADTSEEY